MPTLKHFGAFAIRMYFEDHNPPHVHVTGPDFEALVRIADSAIFAGQIPAAHRHAALAWIAANKDTLMEKWTEWH